MQGRLRGLSECGISIQFDLERYDRCVDCGKEKKRATPHPRCDACEKRRRTKHVLYMACIDCGKVKKRSSPAPRCNRCDALQRLAEGTSSLLVEVNRRHRAGPTLTACVDCGELRRRPPGSRCFDCERIRRTGPGNPAYKDGRVRRKKEWAVAVKERDGQRCTKCGSHEHLHAHHVIPRQERPDLEFDLSNGLTLCRSCHSAVESRRLGTGLGLPRKRTRMRAELRRLRALEKLRGDSRSTSPLG